MKRSKIKVGDVFKLNGGDSCKVITYNNARDIVVEFIEVPYLKRVEATHLRAGRVKSPYTKSVLGVACIGEGEYKVSVDLKITPHYVLWYDMLRRCYCPKFSLIRPTYNEVTVCDEWLNFQNFAKWCDNQPNFNIGWDLDKDLLGGNNKQYNPENCCFLPKDINTSISIKDNKRELPVGVVKVYGGKYRNNYFNESNGGKRRTYPTVIEAREAYIQDKRESFKLLADKYKDQLPYFIYKKIIELEPI